MKETTEYMYSVSYDDTIFILIEDGNEFIDTDKYLKFYKNVYQIYVPSHSSSHHYDSKCIICLEKINEYIDSTLNNSDVTDKDSLSELYNIKYANTSTIDKVKGDMKKSEKASTIFLVVMLIFIFIFIFIFILLGFSLATFIAFRLRE